MIEAAKKPKVITLEPNVFEEAFDIVYGDREQTYGHPAKNLENIADQWGLYLHQKYGVTLELSAEDVCWMMADLKKCRQLNTHKRDNVVDAIGYIGLVQRIEDHKNPENTQD
jgi:hypothetical protein